MRNQQGSFKGKALRFAAVLASPVSSMASPANCADTYPSSFRGQLAVFATPMAARRTKEESAQCSRCPPNCGALERSLPERRSSACAELVVSKPPPLAATKAQHSVSGQPSITLKSSCARRARRYGRIKSTSPSQRPGRVWQTGLRTPQPEDTLTLVAGCRRWFCSLCRNGYGADRRLCSDRKGLRFFARKGNC